jgi:hypothetical protein
VKRNRRSLPSSQCGAREPQQPDPLAAFDAEVRALADKGLLYKEAWWRAGAQDDRLVEAAVAFARRAIVATNNGDCFEEQGKRLRTARKNRIHLHRDTIELQQQLEIYLKRHGRELPFYDFLRDGRLVSLYSEIQRIIDLLDLLEGYALLTKTPKPVKKGRPANFWMLGFIWGMAVCWRQLTLANISSAPSGRFFRFVHAALAAVRPDLKLTESVIDTAIKRFHMKNPEWPVLSHHHRLSRE